MYMSERVKGRSVKRTRPTLKNLIKYGYKTDDIIKELTRIIELEKVTLIFSGKTGSSADVLINSLINMIGKEKKVTCLSNSSIRSVISVFQYKSDIKIVSTKEVSMGDVATVLNNVDYEGETYYIKLVLLGGSRVIDSICRVSKDCIEILIENPKGGSLEMFGIFKKREKKIDLIKTQIYLEKYNNTVSSGCQLLEEIDKLSDGVLTICVINKYSTKYYRNSFEYTSISKQDNDYIRVTGTYLSSYIISEDMKTVELVFKEQ